MCIWADDQLCTLYTGLCRIFLFFTWEPFSHSDPDVFREPWCLLSWLRLIVLEFLDDDVHFCHWVKACQFHSLLFTHIAGFWPRLCVQARYIVTAESDTYRGGSITAHQGRERGWRGRVWNWQVYMYITLSMYVALHMNGSLNLLNASKTSRL